MTSCNWRGGGGSRTHTPTHKKTHKPTKLTLDVPNHYSKTYSTHFEQSCTLRLTLSYELSEIPNVGKALLQIFIVTSTIGMEKRSTQEKATRCFIVPLLLCKVAAVKGGWVLLLWRISPSKKGSLSQTRALDTLRPPVQSKANERFNLRYLPCHL